MQNLVIFTEDIFPSIPLVNGETDFVDTTI